MSGIAALFHAGGGPIDREWIASVHQAMAFRGPDASTTWEAPGAALCHALLRITPQPGSDEQPCTIDGNRYICADARIDDRETLIGRLGGYRALKNASHAELILHAYNKWGEQCTEYLLGDFAFVIYDKRDRSVFGARDHFGIKPFFYAQAAEYLFISNTQDCIQRIPVVSRELNDAAIGDFLLFERNTRTDTTYFRQIAKLPPAHWLRARDRKIEVQRYWSLPSCEPLLFRRDKDYIEEFGARFDQAIKDRLPSGPVAISMSGGIDSACMASAIARNARTDSAVKPIAFTSVYDKLNPDPERENSANLACHLRLPQRFLPIDEIQIGWHVDGEIVRTPDPFASPVLLASIRRTTRLIGQSSRTMYYGEGSDNALFYEWRPYVTWLLRNRQFGRLAGVFAHFLRQRRIPLISSIPRRIAERRELRPEPMFPSWINPDFAQRLKLSDRWTEAQQAVGPLDPIRPFAHENFNPALWSRMAGEMDPSFSGEPVETVWPFLDLRVLGYLLSLPAIPWCRRKLILREYLKDEVPETIRRRAKTPFYAQPEFDRVLETGLPPVQVAAASKSYISWEAVGPMGAHLGDRWTNDFSSLMRVLGLNIWLTVY